MDLKIANKTALVTGASAGIGRAIAISLAAEGARLCITSRRRELLDDVAKEITEAGGQRPNIVALDIVEEGAPKKLAKEALKALGQIDILINCAGGSQPRIPIDAPESAWEDVMRLNFVRVRQLTHEVLPSMIEHKWGRVINITGKSEPLVLISAYSAKAAIHAWQKGLSREVGQHGITINSVAPGRVMSEQILRKYSEEFRAENSKDIPVGRYGYPEEMASVVTFISSPLAAYVTGAVIPVDGGYRRYAF